MKERLIEAARAAKDHKGLELVIKEGGVLIKYQGHKHAVPWETVDTGRSNPIISVMEYMVNQS